jgi:hypothetical protein
VKGHGVGSSKIIPAEEEKEESVSEFIDPNIPKEETNEIHFNIKVKHDREAYDRERKRQERQEAKELEEFYTYMALSDSEKYNRLTDMKYNRFYIEESRRIQKEEMRLKEEEKAEKLKIERKRRRKQFRQEQKYPDFDFNFK